MSLTDEIIELKKETDSVILAHYYVDGAVQELADYVFAKEIAEEVWGEKSRF